MEDLAPTDTQNAIADTARRVAVDCRGKSPAEIAVILGGAGLLGALAQEKCGGLGLGLRDVLPLAVESAYALVQFPTMESMIAAAVLLDNGITNASALLNGSEVATLAWIGDLSAAPIEGGWRLKGTLSRVAGADHAGWIIAPLNGNNKGSLAVLAMSSKGISMSRESGFNPIQTGTDFILDDVDVPLNQVVPGDGPKLNFVTVAGDILRAAELYGAARAAFDAAKTYVSERVQFGRPLTAHQSVRHLLARDYLGLEAVRQSLEYAALAADLKTPDAQIATNIVSGLAAEICQRVSENAIQLHGAMGFTREMSLHRYLQHILINADIRPARVAREALVASLLQKWKDVA